MIGYNSEEKRIEAARQKMMANYVQRRKEIINSEIEESEKKTKLTELLGETKKIEDILSSVRNIEEISEEDREALGIDINLIEVEVDENVVDTLVSIYAKRAKIPNDLNGNVNISKAITLDKDETLEEIDTTEFETELKQYFTEHYTDLLSNGYNHFLSNITEVPDDIRNLHNKYGDLAQIAIKHNIEPEKFHCFGYQITVQDGLVAEEDLTFGRSNIFYANQKGVNKRVEQLYNKIIYEEDKNPSENFFTDDYRKLKNMYLKYAEEHEMQIENTDVFETIEVDTAKVEAIAKYINKVLNNRENVEQSDNTQVFIEDITKNYSKIMNLGWYNFGDLETVKNIVGDNSYIDGLHLKIEEDNITRPDEFRPDIAYGTPEYLARQYQNVMEKVRFLHSSNAFIDGKFDVLKANKEKQALRRYIQENGIEGIDISIPQVEIDHTKANMISDTLIEQYGAEYEDKETMKARILSKVENNWSEIMTEYQCMDINDLLKDELKEMGKMHSMESLYVKDDFICLADFDHFRSKCIYATPEAIKQNIAKLDYKIATRDFHFGEERGRKVLEEYAKENEFNLEIPDIESAKAKRQQEKEMFSHTSSGFRMFETEFVSDDPTARKRIELNDTVLDILVKMSEGVPGAIVGLTALLKADKTAGMLLLGLDDMNIRGSQVWEAYKYLYHENAERFADAVSRRDPKMVDFINQELASIGGEKAVIGGASFDRNKTPDKYRFTEGEVEELRKQRDERREKERKQREKMLANSPAKKNRGAKKRQEREEKRQAHRQRLISMGKKSIGELDEELTELKTKEEQAKELCQQYEEQLPKQPHQEEL